jgi:hypothetical protein
VFDANWDLALADTLRLRASLARRSGDIRVLAERLPGSLDPGTAVDAGVRDARIDLRIDGEREQHGALGQRTGRHRTGGFGTRLVRDATAGTGRWLAPLNGRCRPRLPQVGVWSLLAPPGWRMRGTLDAGLTLAGTRQAPDWSGRLQADGLALRSVVDGIEFGNGRLRARMQGQRLTIEEFLPCRVPAARRAARCKPAATRCGCRPPRAMAARCRASGSTRRHRAGTARVFAGGPAAGGLGQLQARLRNTRASTCRALRSTRPCSCCPKRLRRAWATTS